MNLTRKSALLLIGIFILVASSFAQITTGQWIAVDSDRKMDASRNDEKESSEAALLHVKTRWYKLMHERNANYFAVKEEYDNYFKEHPLETSAPREFGISWLKKNQFYLDNKGIVQPAPMVDYATLPKGILASAPVVTDTVSGSWRMIGPRNSAWVPNVSGTGLGNHGGYVSCVRIDPTNTNKMFVSFQMGGLWTSANNGVAWRLSDANMPAESYFDIDVCKANNTVVYAISTSSLIKSTDGGFSWSTTAMNKTNFSSVGYDLAVSPTNANVVLARWGTELYRTTNGGTSWISIKSGLKNFSTWEHNEILDWDNNNSNIVYLTDRDDYQNYVDVYKSTDAGVSFTFFKKLTLPTGATGTVIGWSKIATATNNTSALYVFVGSGDNAYAHVAAHLYKLDVATGNVLLTRANMVPGTNTDYGSTIYLHHGDITMDITNDSKIIYSGYSNTTAQYSTNNGASFSVSPNDIHSDIRTVHMVGGKVLLGTDGAAYMSINSGASYAVKTNSISNHELWGFGASFKSDVLVAGCNHGPLMIRDNEAPGGWYHILGADQGNSDINPLDNTTIYSSGYDTYHVIRKGVRSWENGPQEIDPGGIYEYFNTLEFHPRLYRTLLTHHGGAKPSGNPNLATWKKSLIKSDDNGLTVKVVFTFNDVLFREKICMTKPQTIYAVVGLANNTLMKSINGGTSWTNITPPASITTAGIRNISDIAVSDVNSDEIWVSYSGVQNTCKVLHSINGGTSYANMTTSVLTSSPITKMIFQRGTSGGVYIGNSSGVYYRNNTLVDWVKLGNGLPQLDVRFMFINYNKGKLLIGTSRGAWDHNLYETSATKAQISASTPTVTKCGGFSSTVKFKDYSVVRNSSATWSWSFPGGTPSISTAENPVISYKNAAVGSYNVSLTVADAHGSNTQTLTNFIKVTQPPVCPVAFDPDAYYKVINRASGKALDVLGFSTADGASIGQWAYGGGDNQLWHIKELGGGYFQLINKFSGKALDNSGSLDDGTVVAQYGPNSGPNQQWQVTDMSGGYYKLKNRTSSKVLDNPASSTTDGTEMIQFQDLNGINQQWQISEGIAGIARVASIPSQALSSELKDDVSDLVSIAPNPAKTETDIVIQSKEKTMALMQLVDMSGSVLLYRNQSLEVGENRVKVGVSEFSSGIYFVMVQLREGVVTKKMLIEK
jgi:PKD repeat protein